MTPDGREIGIQAVPALFAFIGQIQEETHRSAVGFHHRRHTKSGLGSTLERIPGIGEARRKKLLKAFGSVKAIRQADLRPWRKFSPRRRPGRSMNSSEPKRRKRHARHHRHGPGPAAEGAPWAG